MDSKLELQIQETMKRAFWDLIKSDLNAEPQRFDHLIVLIVEIRDRLINLTPNRIDFTNELNEYLDEAFLKHLFNEKSLNPEHFFRLIQFLIKKIKLYAAPYLDNDINAWEKETIQRMETNIVYSEFLPYFFETLYTFIQKIELDVEQYKKK